MEAYSGGVSLALNSEIYKRITANFKRQFEGDGKLLKLFLGYFVQSLFEIMHEAFTRKSKGMVDQFGRKWKKLAPSTIKRKGHKKIMIETERAINSFMPGTVSLSGYQLSGSDQLVALRRASVRIGSKVHYLNFSSRKVIDSADVEELIELALNRAVKKMLPKMQVILESEL